MSAEPAQLHAVVVGAGIVGAACAWRLASAGLTVHVFDKQAPGSGASQVQSPRDVAIDPTTGKVFVADSANNRGSGFNTPTSSLITMTSDTSFSIGKRRSLAS